MSLIEKSGRALGAVTDAQEYRLLYAVAFAVLFPAALAVWLIRTLSGGQPSEGRGSLFAEARATIDSSLAFAFMG